MRFIVFIVLSTIGVAMLFPAFNQTWAEEKAPVTERPRLVCLLVIDGFRADSLTRFEDLFGKGGFKRLMEHGAYFTNAHYGHLTTYTAVGHATISTGAYAYQNGMVGNDWYNRTEKTRMYCCEDADAQWLGEPTAAHGGTSPKNLLSTTFGDELRMSNNLQSRSIAISLKDRAAILLGGKLGQAYWWSTATGRFITSTKYLTAYPEWVEAFNEGKPADAYFGGEWGRLTSESAYARSARDDRPYEIDMAGNGRTFPHRITGGLPQPGEDFYKALKGTPFVDEMTLAFARAAVVNEQLGKRGAPDVLAVGLSANDYVNHLFGPESQEAEDTVLRLDRMLADFFDFLDQEIGLDHIVVALTADHGFMPTPEWSAELGMDAGRIDPAQMIKALSDALSARFGTDDWVAAWWNPTIYLNTEAIQKRGLNASDVESASRDFLRTYPGIAECMPRTQILNGQLPRTALAQRVVKAFFPERSGDVVVIQKPFWYLAEDPSKYASMHGSPYAYDTHVPVILMGRYFAPGRYAMPVDVADIAPTLSNVLEITAPSLSEGRVLYEALAP